MSREYQERIRPIDEDGIANAKSLMGRYYLKAAIAERLFKDKRSAEDNMRIYYTLKSKLDKRMAVSGRL